MLSTPTLQMAKRHFESHLSQMSDMTLYAADRLAFQIAIDCIDTCIAESLRQQARQKADFEVNRALAQLFEGRKNHAENQT